MAGKILEHYYYIHKIIYCIYVCLICSRFRKSLEVNVNTLKKAIGKPATDERTNNIHGNASIRTGNMHIPADFIELGKLHRRYDEQHPRTRKSKNIHHTIKSKSLHQSRPKRLINKWSRKLYDKTKIEREGLLQRVLLYYISIYCNIKYCIILDNVTSFYRSYFSYIVDDKTKWARNKISERRNLIDIESDIE